MKIIGRRQETGDRRQNKYVSPSVFCLLSPVLIVLSGCVTAHLYTAQSNYYQRRFDDAAHRLDAADIPARDRLIALLERGMALQAAGRYEESATAWRAAAGLMEKQDVFHLGEEALSLVFDQTIMSYQPAPYEKPFLHTLLSIDYLMLGDVTSARVEALKSLKDLDARESLVGRMALVRFVAARVFEAAGDFDDARIEYEKANVTPEEDAVPVILFLGRSPRKVFSEVIIDDYKILLPVFQNQQNAVRSATLSFTDEPDTGHASTLLTSVESLASTYSGKLFAKELLKEVLRKKTQEGLIRKVGDKLGSTAEAVLKTMFFFAKEADLRTWASLPATVHLAYEPRETSAPVTVRYLGGDVKSAIASDTIPPPRAQSPLRILRAW